MQNLWLILASMVVITVMSCVSPGEAACQKFQEAVNDWDLRYLSAIEFRQELKRAQDEADSAEPELKRALGNLVDATEQFSEERVLVSIDVAGENCVRAGYLKQKPQLKNLHQPEPHQTQP